MVIQEQSIDICSEHGRMSVYLSGDEDPESEDMRLSFVSSMGQSWLDLKPKEMAQIAALISDTLEDNDYCEHGVPLDEGGCGPCYALKQKHSG